jgi:hypothetical protein
MGGRKASSTSSTRLAFQEVEESPERLEAIASQQEEQSEFTLGLPIMTGIRSLRTKILFA